MKFKYIIHTMIIALLAACSLQAATETTFELTGDVTAVLQLIKHSDTSDFRAENNLNFDSISNFEVGEVGVLTTNPDGFKLSFEADSETSSGSVTYLRRHNGTFYLFGSTREIPYQLRLLDLTGGINSIIDNVLPIMPTVYFTPLNGTPFIIDFDGQGEGGIVNDHRFSIQIEINGGVPLINLEEGDYRSVVTVVLSDS